MPLFCIAAGHNLSYKYQWERGDDKVGVNSPVLWVNEIGLYRCTISNGNVDCFSGVISVTDKDGMFLRIFVHFVHCCSLLIVVIVEDEPCSGAQVGAECSAQGGGGFVSGTCIHSMLYSL